MCIVSRRPTARTLPIQLLCGSRKTPLCDGDHSGPALNVALLRARETAEANMTTLYFHCVGTQGALLDRRGSDIEDVCDARARAFQIIHTIVGSLGPEDWRDWSVHVRDDDGEELLQVPFSTVLGKPH
jgi:hypothetical protein